MGVKLQKRSEKTPESGGKKVPELPVFTKDLDRKNSLRIRVFENFLSVVRKVALICFYAKNAQIYNLQKQILTFKNMYDCEI